MPHLPFIVAAYVVTLGGLGTMLIVGLRRMRRAEAATEQAAREER